MHRSLVAAVQRPESLAPGSTMGHLHVRLLRVLFPIMNGRVASNLGRRGPCDLNFMEPIRATCYPADKSNRPQCLSFARVLFGCDIQRRLGEDAIGGLALIVVGLGGRLPVLLRSPMAK